METLIKALTSLFKFFPESIKAIGEAMPKANLYVKLIVWLLSLGMTGGIIYAALKIFGKTILIGG